MKEIGWSTPLLAAGALVLCACSDDAGDGTLEVEIWGEEFIEQGIPGEELEDGWAVTYARFIVVVGDISIGAAGEEPTPAGGVQVVNLVAAGPHALDTLALESRTYDDVGYAITPATTDAVAHESATEADLQEMQDGGLAILVEGEATRGADTKTFAWTFQERTAYHHCVDNSSGQELHGVVVPDGSSALAQLTIHGDHLFYDDLASTDAVLRFNHMANADADMDGEVTMAELDAVALASLPPDEGPYTVGASDVNDLGAYVRAATETLGHFNGEGHCEIE